MKIGKSEGGQGGKRGHSGMEHWEHTEDIKQMAKRLRRRIDRKLQSRAVTDMEIRGDDEPTSSIS